MNDEQDFDCYEILEISPNASPDTIDRVFRYLAQRYHPDHRETGNAEKFIQLVKAHDVLKDPEKRAAYDVKYKKNADSLWMLQEEASDLKNFENDDLIHAKVLSFLYTKRKRDVRNAGSGYTELVHLTGCPSELLDFHLWYLREKGWIMRLEDGLLAITADGVDKALAIRCSNNIDMDKLLTDLKYS